MTINWRNIGLFGAVGFLILLDATWSLKVGPSDSFTIFAGTWNAALSILIVCLASAIMALGVNIQWGYAGLSIPELWALWRLARSRRCCLLACRA